MLKSSIYRVVDLCTRRAWLVIALAATLAVVCGMYTARHFAVTTDTKALFPPDLPWAKRAFQYMRAFPQPGIIVVVQAPTPKMSSKRQPRSVRRSGQAEGRIRACTSRKAAAFSAQRLLYLPTGGGGAVDWRVDQGRAAARHADADPSLRGSLDASSDGAGRRACRDDPARRAEPGALTWRRDGASSTGRPTRRFFLAVLASGHAAQPDEFAVFSRSSRCSITMRSNPVARRPTQSRKPRANCSSASGLPGRHRANRAGADQR